MSEKQNKVLELADTGEGAIVNVMNAGIRKEYAVEMLDKHVFRASSSDKCSKALWFKRNSFEPDSRMEPRTKALFRVGHISEVVMLNDLQQYCVGPGKPWAELNCGKIAGTFVMGDSTYNHFHQLSWSWKHPNGETISCHPDAVARLHDGTYELIDTKTYSNFGFMKFAKEETPAIEAIAGYEGQAHSLMNTDEAKALKITRFRFVGMRKDTSHMADRVIRFDQEIMDRVIQNFSEAGQENAPEDAYDFIPEMTGRKPNKKPTGRYTVPWQCSYCSYMKTCKGESQIEFKSGKPIHIFEPKKKEGA